MLKYTFIIIILLVSISYLLGKTVKIMPLGDSITRGTYNGGIPNEAEALSYRYKLWQLLTNAGYDFEFVGSRNSGYNIFPMSHHAGFPGITAAQLTHLLATGYNQQDNVQETIGPYLDTYLPDIILLHIGTNDLKSDTNDIGSILNKIDAYKNRTGKNVQIIIARILDKIPADSVITNFNNNLFDLIQSRHDDQIKVVDMQHISGFRYQIDRSSPFLDGEMYSNVHPNQSGYNLMANIWFSEIMKLFGDKFTVFLTQISIHSFVDHVELAWETDGELGNKGFEIYKSIDELSFDRVADFSSDKDLIGQDTTINKAHYFYEDFGLNQNEKYWYKIKSVGKNNLERWYGPISIQLLPIQNFRLHQNYPNPFNLQTNLSFELPKVQKLNFAIFNSVGQRIRTLYDGWLNSGFYRFSWDGKNDSGMNVAGGVYFAILTTSEFKSGIRLLLLK